MTPTWLDQLPESYARHLRMASVAPTVVAMFSHLPKELQLDAELPADAAAIPEAARELVKLGLGGTRLVLRSLTRSPGGTTQLVVSLDERRCVLSAADLASGIGAVTGRILKALLDQTDFIRILEVFAFQSWNLATLQRIINHMLQSTDVDKALYAMLSGITSGHGLGFNRAVLFIHDPDTRRFVGSKAIGPSNESEAHRIWEEIAYEDKSIDRLIEDYALYHFDTPLQQSIQQVTLTPTENEGDEVVLAQQAQRPLLFSGPQPRNPSLGQLHVAGEFVLGAIRPHGTTLGLIFADNRYSATPITDEQLNYFSFFIDQTALVWENLSLLERVEMLARYDGLTGVFNRREFEARFQDEKSRCVRSQGTCSLMIMDIDLFKEVNDRLGHEAGDEVLRRLGGLLSQAFRTHDVLGRYGGDEFIVLLPDTAKDHLALAARRIGATAREHGISLSIGAANWPADCTDPAALLSTADANLYRAKRAGRGCAFLGADERLGFE